MPDQLEIEVKFIVADPVTLSAKLQALQLPSTGPYLERNIWLDNARSKLRSRQIVLRVRSIEKDEPGCIVTVKTPVDHADEHFRIQREIEFAASDHSAVLAAFEVLGYTPVWQYEKKRTVFTCNSCEICLDELPIGWFIEFEGSRAEILAVSDKLGFKMAQAITLNYESIFLRLRDKIDLKLKNLTFENYNDFLVDPIAYHDLLF